MGKRTLRSLLQLMVERGASDLHIGTGSPPMFRVDGSLTPADREILTPQEAKGLCFEDLSEEQIKRFETGRSIDFSFGIEGISRFRANIYWARDSVIGAFRSIPHVIPNMNDLGLPPSVLELTERPRGLVLVTGPTGSGKSTTLAAMIDRINETRAGHIITVEDPIEYLYKPKCCIVHQQEVGRDTPNFQQALKYILRQDPDIVLIGEMRDLETMRSAITIAETGHLVFATLHTNTAGQTIDRIIDVFPSHQQNQIRTQLSFILEGVLCQQLVPKMGGGRTLALEVLLPTHGIRHLIREGKVHQIYSQMQMGQQHTGMVTLDQSLARLVSSGVIDEGEGSNRCVSLEEFEKQLHA